MLVFDIETAPLPDEQLREIYKSEEFDASSVKLGRLKDPDKIKIKIEEARQEHAARFDKFKAEAALDAATGQVLAIGYYNPAKEVVRIRTLDDLSEADLVAEFWARASQARAGQESMVGLNIHDFDLPFLMRRAWLLGRHVPDWVLRQGRYFDSTFVDLRKVWLCGQWGAGTKSNFDHIGKAFGTGGKQDGLDGSMFAELWEKDRETAIGYLENDLKQPALWAERMGIT